MIFPQFTFTLALFGFDKFQLFIEYCLWLDTNLSIFWVFFYSALPVNVYPAFWFRWISDSFQFKENMQIWWNILYCAITALLLLTIKLFNFCNWWDSTRFWFYSIFRQVGGERKRKQEFRFRFRQCRYRNFLKEKYRKICKSLNWF